MQLTQKKRNSRVTLKEIASHVGVSVSTVSDVLRDRKGKVSVSANTRNKISQVVQELGYRPNDAARALVTGRMERIGFLVSSQANYGLANYFYADMMSGVCEECTRRDYSLTVGTANLETVEKFVMPTKLHHRSVDGLVVVGQIQEQVIQVLIDLNIPFVLLGNSCDYQGKGVLAVDADMKGDMVQVFDYLLGLGHRHIAFGGFFEHQKLFELAVDHYRQLRPGHDFRVSMYPRQEGGALSEFDEAYKLGSRWGDLADRPTVVIGHDQFSSAFLSGVVDCGYSCPDDVSVVSTCDTPLCQWGRPSITALTSNIAIRAQKAADLLIDYLERNITWIEANRKALDLWEPSHLTIRSSTGPVLKSKNIKD